MSSHTVTPGKIDIRRVVDGNVSDPPTDKERVSVVKFHPSGETLMVGSTDKYIRFFKVDGERNEKQHGVNFADLSITTAGFVGRAHNHVVVGGRKPFFYTYDLKSGRSMKVGVLFLVSCPYHY